jgi:hypothetical protein
MQDEDTPSVWRRLGRGVLQTCGHAARIAGPALAAAWRVAKPVLRGALEFLLALIIVFEEWGWQPLAALLGRLARWRPWAAVESVIIRLPPYLALVVFVLPSALLLPLKFLALLLIAKGQIVLASLLFVAAKVVATALIARLFMLTQPALMQIGWFARGHDTLVPLKDALVARVHASWVWRTGRVLKERARRLVAAQWRRWRPAALELAAAMRASLERARAGTGRLLREMRERWATFRSSL